MTHVAYTCPQNPGQFCLRPFCLRPEGHEAKCAFRPNPNPDWPAQVPLSLPGADLSSGVPHVPAGVWDALVALAKSLTALANLARLALCNELERSSPTACEVCDAMPTIATEHGPRCAFHGLYPEALEVVIARRQAGVDTTDALIRYRASASQDPRNYCESCNELARGNSPYCEIHA